MNAIARPASRHSRQAHQHWERGVALSRKRQWGEALKCFEAALKIDPRDDVYLLNAAKAAMECGHLEQALDCSRRALKLQPSSELGRFLCVTALHRLHRYREIVDYLTSLPEALCDSREHWSALGAAQQNLAQHKEAISSFMNALTIKIDDAMTHYLMGISFYEMQLKEEASECFRTGLVLGLGSNALHVHGMLAYTERESGRWKQADEELANMDDMVSRLDPTARVKTAPFAHITLTSDPLQQLKACRLMSNTFDGIKPVDRPQGAPSGERIRLGYVSADFHQHATAVLMAEVFEQHDRSRFEVFLYSHGTDDKSPMRKRIEAAAEHFVNLEGQPDQVIAERIASDNIDLLIDLKGYTAQHRMVLFARRPAAVQATYLGFPGTTGAKFMDYIIGDPVVTPAEHAAHFAEHIAQMPVCYQPNDRLRPKPAPTTRAEAGLPEDKLVLCGFNQAYKISAEVLDEWVALLKALPDAVLWLLDWHGQAKPHLLEEFRIRGIEADRVYWAPRKGLAEHLSRIPLADIFIDTWPCNAHTTASDALWAGVPVVTYMGQTFASRVAASLLNAVGLSELVTENLSDYRRTVCELAADPQRRQHLRQVLQQAREQAPLFDSPRYVRALDDLFERIVLRHRAGLPPEYLPAMPA